MCRATPPLLPPNWQDRRFYQRAVPAAGETEDVCPVDICAGTHRSAAARADYPLRHSIQSRSTRTHFMQLSGLCGGHGRQQKMQTGITSVPDPSTATCSAGTVPAGDPAAAPTRARTAHSGSPVS